MKDWFVVVNTHQKISKGLFVGLCTLDVLQIVDTFPHQNQKVRAEKMSLAAGGPATNAAVIFAQLGGYSDLVTRLSNDAIGKVIRADLNAHKVNLHIIPEPYSTTVASIIVTSNTGDRAVVSAGDGLIRGKKLNKNTIIPLSDSNNLSSYPTLCLDGYNSDAALTILKSYKNANPNGFSILDAGSYKSDTDNLLPYLDCVVASANFQPTNTKTPKQIFNYLHDFGVKYAAITQGEKPILASLDGKAFETPAVSVSKVVDTLGAGDFFHGAFAYAIAHNNCTKRPLNTRDFKAALDFASKIAAKSITSFGSRSWLTAL